MDVECDFFDAKLLEQFRSMGTTDRDVLIKEFQAVLGNDLAADSCAFFLEMNDWNLANALCSYFDFGQSSVSLPSMKVEADVTIGEGEAVAPNTCFVYSWKIRNAGPESWSPGCSLAFCNGDNLGKCEMKLVNALRPGEIAVVHLEMKSPGFPGIYSSQWRMKTATGIYFGDIINVKVTVQEGGLLGLTQQLSRIGEGCQMDESRINSSNDTDILNASKAANLPSSCIPMTFTPNPSTQSEVNEDTEMS